MGNKSEEVTQFLNKQNHPLRKEIEKLRITILSSELELTENIKWNGPNYCHNNEDRITIKIQPPKNLQIIFHCGAKVKVQPKEKLLKKDFELLVWKGNDRAVATFNNMQEIENRKSDLMEIIIEWIKATK